MYQVYLKNQKSELGLVLFFTIILATLVWGANFIDVSATTGIPKLISHQGQLLDSSGNLLGGSGTNFCFRFSLYDNKTVGLGNKLWPIGTPSTMTTSVKNGIYNINIGDTGDGGDLLDYNFQDNDATFLNIEVATSTAGSCASVTYFENLNPRKRITSAPYAFSAGAILGTGQSAIGTTSPAFNAELTVEATTTSSIALIVRGIAGQIADIFNVITSEGKTLVYTKDGLLGVGTSTPSSALSVQGNGLFSGNLSLANLTATGTLTVSNTASTSALIVSGSLRASNGLGSNGNCLTTNGSTLISWGSCGSGSQTPWTSNIDGGGFSLTNVLNASTTFLSVGNQFWAGGTGTTTITSAGWLGIGISTPLEQVHIAGGSLLQDSPTSPSVVGGTSLSLPGGGVLDVFVLNNYAYAIFGNAAGVDILRIIDISNPTAPLVVGGATLNLPGNPRSIYVSGGYAYIIFDNAAGTDIFRIIDISNPANPADVITSPISLPANGQGVFVSGNYAHITFDNAGGVDNFRIIDVSRPQRPAVISDNAMSLPAAAREVYAQGRYAYVVFYNTVSTDAFRVIDISKPESPSVVGGGSLALGFSAWSINVSGRYAYIGFDNTAGEGLFRVVDISNPANPSIAGGSALDPVLPGFAKSLFAAGRYVYVAFDNATGVSGLRIIDVRDPANPIVAGGASLSLPGFPKAIEVRGRYAYLGFFQGAGTDTFRVVDITGIETVSGSIQSLLTATIDVSKNASIKNQLSVGGGISVGGGGIFSLGHLAIVGNSTFSPNLEGDSSTAFRIFNQSGLERLFLADTIANRIKIGNDSAGGTATTLFVLDKKADAGDPTGTNGAMYYNDNTGKFRCFENGAWKNCDTSGGLTPTFLTSDVVTTSTSIYETIFTIPLTASKMNIIEAVLVQQTSGTAVGIQNRGRIDTAGQTGACTFTNQTGATAGSFDTIAVSTNPNDTGDTSAAITTYNTNIVKCSIVTTGTPGNLILEFQAEVAGTVTTKTGSYYTQAVN